MARIIFIALIALAAVGLLWLTKSERATNLSANTEKPNNVANWNLYTAPSGKFRVFFPALPQNASTSVMDATTKKNKYFSTFISPKTDGSAYMVNVISYVPKEEPGDERMALTSAVQDMVDANKDNRLVEMKESSFKGNKAYDFLVESNTVELIGKAFMKDKQLYMLTMVTPKGKADIKEFGFFVNSFEPISK